MVALVLLALIVALGVASYLGWTADSRDPEYTLGRVTELRRPAEASPAGTLPRDTGPRSSVDRAAAF